MTTFDIAPDATPFVIRTRSQAPYALVAWVTVYGAPHLVGYAYSTDAKVKARARRLRARILPIIDGAVKVPCPT